jgi:hypothetical protein
MYSAYVRFGRQSKIAGEWLSHQFCFAVAVCELSHGRATILLCRLGEIPHICGDFGKFR